MNLHEYQAKELLKVLGLPVLPGVLCHTASEAAAAYKKLGGQIAVIKAQVHAGGRGKGGGVKIAKSEAEAKQIAEKIIGMTLITPQTGEKGKLVKKVYVEGGCNIAKEFYLSLLLDRATKTVSFVASTEGGMDIEEVHHKTPEKIITVSVDPKVGIQPFQATKLAFALSVDPKKFAPIATKLYEAFIKYDLSLLEINPLVLTKEGEFVLLDAKCAIDDNAMFRHPDFAALLDPDEYDPKDLKATSFGLSYIALDGNIGCLVNGAGLAMATMDIIKMYGGTPANFLDVGGGASKETVTEAFKILLSDDKVKAILVNIFGGIMRCDVIAQGIVDAAKELGIKVPLVVRLQGTNVELGREILSKSGLTIIPAITMDEAAEKAVAAVKG